MKMFLLLFLLTGLTGFLSAQDQAKGEAFAARTEWHEKWKNSLAYTQEALASVPDSSLSYRPSPGQMSIQEQVQHIAGNVYGLSRRFLDYEPQGFNEEALRAKLAAETLSRAELLTLLNEAYAFGHAAIDNLPAERWDEDVPNFFAGPRSRRVIVYLLQDHATHHRAQVLMYLRLLGIEPPRYRGW